MEEILDSIGSGNVIIVDNLPSVPFETYKRLEDFLINKMFRSFGVITHFLMPRDESTSMTEGRAFITYNTPEAAQRACAKMNGFKLSKAHQLSIVIA
jgi:translation initiation factor 3 subunit B